MSELRFWAKLAATGALLGLLAFYMVMRVSLKGGNVTMPDLRGLPQKAAAMKLQGLGLDMTVREERYSPTAAFGAVLEQSMEPGATLKRGRTIAVVVSIGNKVLAVPQLVGSPSARQARLLLEQNGLTAGRTAYLNSDQPRETVLAQSPESGQQASRGEGVSLLISAGPRQSSRVMPDLRGRSLDEARGLAGRMGLVLRRVIEAAVAPADAVPGSVLSQSLPPATRVELGQELALTVTAGGMAAAPARLASVGYEMPEEGVQERRLKLVVRDSLGERLVHNKMEQPGAIVKKEVKVHGPAMLEISVGGVVLETKEIP